jgi:predicted RNA binding protein YcfA (HicA-like mRNA interferase family)
MPRRFTVRELIRILTADGWYEVRSGGGDHRQFKHPSKPGRVTVDGKAGQTLPIGTEASVFRQAGLNRKDYL